MSPCISESCLIEFFAVDGEFAEVEEGFVVGVTGPGGANEAAFGGGEGEVPFVLGLVTGGDAFPGFSIFGDFHLKGHGAAIVLRMDIFD